MDQVLVKDHHCTDESLHNNTLLTKIYDIIHEGQETAEHKLEWEERGTEV